MNFENLENIAEAEKKSEKLWEKIEPEARNFYETVARERYGENPDEYDKENMKEEIEKGMEREKYFFQEVLEKVLQTREENVQKENLLLFDIDETIGRTQFNDKRDKIVGTMLRPSLKALFDLLKKEDPNLKFGFLSTRGYEHIKKQLNEPNQLAPIKEYIESDEIYSASETKNQFESLKPEEIQKKLKQYPDINQELISEDIAWALDSQDFRKLEVIKDIYEKKPETVIIPVDDAQFPKYLKHGVCLHENGGF